MEYISMKKEVMDAILLGYVREIVDEDEEIDVEMANLEKNKTHQGCHS